MKILAFETSCDDTSIAIFENDKLIFMDTKSQIKLHNPTGGVVPEVAAREHANSIFDVLSNVLEGSSISLYDLDYIAVTKAPGLIPSLLTGIIVAKSLSNILNIELIEINHIEAHIFANYLDRNKDDISFPLVCLTVSGGHNEIYHIKSMFDINKIGSTIDDSAGEAFDKVAKMMGLGYPGGPIISKLANEYKLEIGESILKNKINLFPRVRLKKDEYDFSFSGLKSCVKREVDKRGTLSFEDKKEISYEFQKSVIEVLSYKLVNSSKKLGIKNIMLAGGVSANDDLVDLISKESEKLGLNFIFPSKKLYCGDNAGMVGINAFYKILKKSNFTSGN